MSVSPAAGGELACTSLTQAIVNRVNNPHHTATVRKDTRTAAAASGKAVRCSSPIAKRLCARRIEPPCHRVGALDTEPIAGQTLSYGELYRRLRSDRESLDGFLPALAFWSIGSRENHPEPMQFMDDCENYIAGGEINGVLSLSLMSAKNSQYRSSPIMTVGISLSRIECVHLPDLVSNSSSCFFASLL